MAVIINASTSTGLVQSADTSGIIQFQSNGSTKATLGPSGFSYPGAVLQVVTVNKTDAFTHSTTTWTDVTGLSASITPSATSSKILVLASVAIGSAGDFAYIRLLRDSTVIDIGDTASNRVRVTGAIGYSGGDQPYNMDQVPVMYLDSPSTTSAVTYKFQLRSGSSNFLVAINQTGSDRDTSNYEWRTPSNIVLMEVAA